MSVPDDNMAVLKGFFARVAATEESRLTLQEALRGARATNERNHRVLSDLQAELRKQSELRIEADCRAESYHHRFQEMSTELCNNQEAQERALEQERSAHQNTKKEICRLRTKIEYMDQVVCVTRRSFETGQADGICPLSKLVEEELAKRSDQVNGMEDGSEGSRAEAISAVRHLLEAQQRAVLDRHSDDQSQGDAGVIMVKTEGGLSRARSTSGRSRRASPYKGRRQLSRRAKGRCRSTEA